MSQSKGNMLLDVGESLLLIVGRLRLAEATVRYQRHGVRPDIEIILAELERQHNRLRRAWPTGETE